MLSVPRTVLALAALAFTFGLQAWVHAQDSKAKDTGDRHLPWQSPQHLGPRHHLPAGGWEARPPSDKLQDLQWTRCSRYIDRGPGCGRRCEFPQEQHRAS